MSQPDDDYLKKWQAVLEERGGRLSRAERQVVAMRLGLEDGMFHTLEEVGRRFEITRERAHALEVRAFHKLSGKHIGLRRRDRREGD